MRLRSVLCLTSAIALALPVLPATAQSCNDALVPQPEDCRRANADIVVRMPAGENTETVATRPGAGFAETGFSISIDGAPVVGAAPPANPDRDADRAADAFGVDVRFDGFERRRLLNVATDDLRAAYRAGEQVTFRASTSYPAFIDRAEVRIVDPTRPGRPVVAVLPVAPNGTVAWTMPGDGPGEVDYVLRVYDAGGRFDETIPLALRRTSDAFATHETTGAAVAAGEGADRTRVRGIPVRGGRVTVSGSGAAPGRSVTVMDEAIPVDDAGRFVAARTLPPGLHTISIDAGDGRRVVRDIEVPASDWFYVGIVDLTFGYRLQDDLAEADPDFERAFADGRVGVYAKGQTAGGYTFTGSLDTGYGPLEDIFRRFDDKDPRKVIERLDEDDGYPTFGDDSTSFDDAPTSGRVYLQIERDGSTLTWGDFNADLGTDGFLRTRRSLYGAELRFRSTTVTDDGRPRTAVTLYGAQPDTLPQRDILRGTGGSLYFLSRQDINGLSETITIEVVDPDTGRVVELRRLAQGIDYDIDYIQGVLILAEPVGSSASDGGLIRDGATGAFDVNIVAEYEYTPTTGSLDGASVGGRAKVWLTDQLRLGVTAMRDETGTADQTASGADLRFEFGETSFVEAEIAETDGPGFGRAFSTNGGLSISSGGVASGRNAAAYRFDSRLDFADLGLAMPGSLTVYAEQKEAGFETLSESVTQDQTVYGATLEAELTPRLTFGFDGERFTSDDGSRKAEAEVRLGYALSDRVTVSGALGWLDRTTPGVADETGERIDAALRLDYAPSEDLSVYVFGQATLSAEGGIARNDRIGIGASAQVTEKLRFSGEVSEGDGGLGATARVSYQPTPDNEVYFGYTLDPTRRLDGTDLIGDDDGTFLLGARYRYSDTLSTYTENTWDLYGARRSLARAYGVTYTPDASWTFSGGMEVGEVRDSANGDFDRTALSFGVGYSAESGTAARVRLEYRTEDGTGIAQDRETWAATAGLQYRVSEDWRVVADADALFSDSDQSSFLDGEYLEATVGFAYRPVMNERLNMLARYTYLRDLPGDDQVTGDGTTSGPKQISHVFSIDADYDLTPRLSIGGKYGLRRSEVAPRGTSAFTNSTAHLGIARVDWHVVHKFDVMGEVRALRTVERDVTEYGALLGLYRHVGNNAKIGVGYEWGRVSDDLTDLDYDGQNVFINMIAKF